MNDSREFPLRVWGYLLLAVLSLFFVSLACDLTNLPKSEEDLANTIDDLVNDEGGSDDGIDSDVYIEEEELGGISDSSDSGAGGSTGEEAPGPGSGDLKPVGFVNYGTVDAVVRPWTWLPIGSVVRQAPVSASTVSSANDGIGDWPNSSRFLSVPMGSYTWCVDWEEGDLDDDGQIDYSHYFIDEPTVLDENDSDELEFAEEVSISAPPTVAAIYTGRCGAPPTALCTGEIEVSAQVLWASTTDDPPDFFAYANPEVRASPPGVSVTFGGSTSGFDTARLLLEQGAWIEASTANPLYAMGVQIMGDQYIGWARVLFDGTEIWSGDTAHTWNEGANYGEYVEVRCFPPGEHTLRVENLGIEGGYGGTMVPISWFAFRR